MRIRFADPDDCKRIFVCRECGFLHTDQYDIDKCPYCRGDDWIYFNKEEEDDE